MNSKMRGFTLLIFLATLLVFLVGCGGRVSSLEITTAYELGKTVTYVFEQLHITPSLNSTPSPTRSPVNTPKLSATVVVETTLPSPDFGKAVYRLDVFLVFLNEVDGEAPDELTGFFDDAHPADLKEGLEALDRVEGIDFEEIARNLERLAKYYEHQPLLHLSDDFHELFPFELSGRCEPPVLKMLQIHGPEWSPGDRECRGYFDDDKTCKEACTIWAEAYIDEGCYAFLERPSVWFLEGEFYESQLKEFFTESCVKLETEAGGGE